MTLRITYAFNLGPISYGVDLNSTFEAGMIAQMSLWGNNVVCGVSDGTAPLGIIDDERTTAYYAPAIDEVKIIPAVGQLVDGRYVTIIEIMATLNHATITTNSFVCDIPVFLNETNGVITIPIGTELNYDSDGDGHVDSVRCVCSYIPSSRSQRFEFYRGKLKNNRVGGQNYISNGSI